MAYGTGLLFLSAVAGYWVLERAATHKGNLKRIGQLVGGVILIGSLVGVACRVWALATGKGSFSCPFSQKASPPPSR